MSFLSRRRLLASTGAGMALNTLGPAWQGHGQDATATAPQKPAPPVDPYHDAVLVDGEPPLPQAGGFTFAVLPDTQFYSQRHPDLFLAQTEWIVKQRDARRIAGVFHLGDITHNNTPQQWENARRAMKVLDDANMPYCMVPGNHDYGKGGQAADRTTLLNETFPIVACRRRRGWRGTYDREPDRIDNTFQFMEAGGRKFLILGLEFGPRADVIRWATEVAGDHPDHEVILVTPAQGREIPQQLVNFQMRPNGGDGWLRLVEMLPDGTAQTYDYSPTRGQRNESPQNQFAFRVPTVGA